jgi:hypothetical protein
MKEKSVHIISIGTLLVFIVLGLGSTATVELGQNYDIFLQPPVGNERVIDIVRHRGNTHFVCRDPNHAITPAQRLGASYQVRENSGTERHRHESIINQLQNEATRLYPRETVNIRNARTMSHHPTNPRIEEYTESVRQRDGSVVNVRRTRHVWDCFPVYLADVITTEPMPQPVVHTENFTKPGSTRNDIYRLARNWLDDNTQRRRIRIDSEDFNRGRIVGTVTAAARADQTYLVTSVFTIDVFDARVEIRFENTTLQRTDASLQSAGRSEPIFLQSIADATLAEIVDFSTTLKSFIQSR